MRNYGEMAKRSVAVALEKGTHSAVVRSARCREEYEEKPNTCITCDAPIPYEKRWNKYCDHSCSAKTTNTKWSRWSLERGNCLKCGIKLVNPRSKYCSMLCGNIYRTETRLAQWLDGSYDGSAPSGELSESIRRYILDESHGVCSLCGWNQTNPVTGKVPLCVDHSDGNPGNNSRMNLRAICPNCHSLTPTYGALNKGNGRTLRGIGQRGSVVREQSGLLA